MNGYPPFDVPRDIAHTPVPEWTDAEANRYLTWLSSNADGRVAAMLSFLGEPDGESRGLLSRVGGKAVWVLTTPEFSGAGSLNELGYALAADMGLLVSQRLVRELPHLAWRVVRRPRGSPSYN